MPFVTKVNVSYTDSDSGLSFDLPALFTESGLIVSHLRYLAWFHQKSSSWKERSVFSLKLLIEYINARTIQSSTATDLLKSFSTQLVTGTIDYDSFDDPLGLFWKPRKIRDSNSILFHITHYTDFLARQAGYETSRINPFIKSTNHEERLNWCAYYQQQRNVFLNHLSTPRNQDQVRLIGHHQDHNIDNDKVFRFPEHELERLIYLGFNKDSIPDYKSQAITMLLNYGGLRKSEVFHIYISDITQNPLKPEEALVRVYHPEFGSSPDPYYKNRAEYLMGTTHYKPRNKYRLSERLFAGWKSPLLTSRDGHFEVIFSPPSKAREFLNVWVNYLKFQRVDPPDSDFHPFAFTNSDGHPETLKNFQRQHKLAVEKIGLEFSKAAGTTEHGHRHAYGFRLRSYGLDQIEIQKAMHHKSPTSCLVYIKPTNEEVREKMRKVEL